MVPYSAIIQHPSPSYAMLHHLAPYGIFCTNWHISGSSHTIQHHRPLSCTIPRDSRHHVPFSTIMHHLAPSFIWHNPAPSSTIWHYSALLCTIWHHAASSSIISLHQHLLAPSATILHLSTSSGTIMHRPAPPGTNLPSWCLAKG